MFVINQNQIAFTIFLVVEELAVIAQVVNKFTVTVDISMQVAELAR